MKIYKVNEILKDANMQNKNCNFKLTGDTGIKVPDWFKPFASILENQEKFNKEMLKFKANQEKFNKEMLKFKANQEKFNKTIIKRLDNIVKLNNLKE